MKSRAVEKRFLFGLATSHFFYFNFSILKILKLKIWWTGRHKIVF